MIPFRPFSEESLQWYLRGVTTAYLANGISPGVEEVPEEMQEPFNAGLLDGETWATQGFPVDPVCYDLSMPHNPVGTAAEGFDIAAETFGIGRSILHGALGAAFFETAVLALILSIAFTTHQRFPEEVMQSRPFEEFAEFLGSSGELVSMELFMGGAIDPDAEGCQLLMTPVFKTIEEARAAIQQTGRSKHLICSVRTEMSGGMRIVEQGES